MPRARSPLHRSPSARARGSRCAADRSPRSRCAGPAALLGLLAGPLLLTSARGQDSLPPPRPNFVVIFTDDQGYGDLGCYGAEGFRTPRIDSLATDGLRLSSFYAQVVCGPSRSALLTGRYPVRSHGWSMPADELTMAELLKTVGYRTACFGKWDVSNRAPIVERMPLAQGFDEFWGTLGANDGGTVAFHRGDQREGGSEDMAELTRRYTDAAIEFLESAQGGPPFFLYLAHTMVHSVIAASPEFEGSSEGELYGDVMQELDFHTGRLLDAIDRLEMRDDTVVVFTSDNGAWNNFADVLRPRHDGRIAWGSSGPLREGKGSTYEGGLRVPCLVRWPGHVPAGRTSDAIVATLDLLPTFAAWAGAELPTDRRIDGVDQRALLTGRDPVGARQDYAYFCRGEFHALRVGKWKLFAAGRERFYGYVDDRGTPDQVELYDLEADLGETTNLASEHPQIVQEMQARMAAFPLPEEEYFTGIRLPKPQDEDDE